MGLKFFLKKCITTKTYIFHFFFKIKLLKRSKTFLSNFDNVKTFLDFKQYKEKDCYIDNNENFNRLKC